jgi:hypothetical protein
MDSRTRLWFAAAALMLSAPLSGHLAAAPACHAHSGPLVRPVVELFTSEGCDSCPPADRWFSATFKDARDGPLALAFHVDYWDRLGWKDRFAQAAYTERQQHAADVNHAGFVYTPQVLVQGRDVRWRDAAAAGALRNAAQPALVSVDLDVEREAAAIRVRATARPAGTTPLPADTSIVLAYVDNDLESEVKAGENRGVRLHHDHVVRALQSGARADGRNGVVADTRFALPAEAGRDPALVAFVQRAKDGAILQAVALPLADCPPP